LRECGGRVYGPSGAAAKLGIPRTTLETKIKSLKINKYRFKGNRSLERQLGLRQLFVRTLQALHRIRQLTESVNLAVRQSLFFQELTLGL
jgi:hypothetical protein